MIIYGLHDYLTNPASVDTRLFSSAQTGLGLTLKHRDDARRELQSRIGRDVYFGRNPEGFKPAYMLLDVINTSSQPTTAGVTDTANSIVQIDCYTSGHHAPQRNQVLSFLVRMACDGFYGKKWGDYFVTESTLQNISSEQLEPIDGQGKWSFVTSLDFSVYYQAASPVF